MPGDGGSGIDLFGTGEGYRPGRNTYTINGLPATESQFMMEIESGHIGGTFGLIEMAARMSAPRYLVTDTYITEAVYWGTDWEQAGSATRRSETMTVHRVFFEGWSILNSIVPYSQTPVTEPRQLTNDEVTGLKGLLRGLTSVSSCNGYLSKLLENLRTTGNSAYKSSNINEIFESIISESSTTLWSFDPLPGARAQASTSVSRRGDGYIALRIVTLRFDAGWFGFTPKAFFGRPLYDPVEAGLILIHELLHASGIMAYNHQTLAQFAQHTAQELGAKVADLPDPRSEEFFNNGKFLEGKFDKANAFYFNNVINQFCGGQQK